jgi:outer membrane protein TolC
MEERSRVLDGGAITPQRTYPDDRATQSQTQWNKWPPSTNPPPEELRYEPAVEARDIAAKLSQYQESLEPAPGASPLQLSLEESFRIAQRQAREYLGAEEEYILAAIRLLIERHLWGPRFFNDTTLSLGGSGDDGEFRSALTVINDLRVTKRLPFGGSVEAAFITQATDQLREQASGGYRQSSELVLDGNVPLLRGAGLVAQESLIQAERNLVYAARTFENYRRDFLLEVAIDYFNLLETRAAIENQVAQVDLLENILRGQRLLFENGRIAAFDVNIAANDVLNARASLAAQRESFILGLERFKLRLGLDPQTPVALNPGVLALPEPEVTLDEAVQLALSLRLDLQNRRDQVDDARRNVAIARNQLLPDLNLAGRVGVPTDPDDSTGGVAISPDNLSYNASVTFGLPLDREQERLGLRSAVIRQQQEEREFDLFRDQVAVGVRQAVRNIDLARFQYELAQRRVEINEARVRETQLKQDRVDTQKQVDAANALQEARNARDRAQTDLRVAILRYLRDSGQLRVAKDGTFQPLPGMDRGGIPPAELTPEPADPQPAEPRPGVPPPREDEQPPAPVG